jgi:hypothetical protein
MIDINDEVLYFEELDDWDKTTKKLGAIVHFADDTKLTIFSESVLPPDDVQGDVHIQTEDIKVGDKIIPKGTKWTNFPNLANPQNDLSSAERYYRKFRKSLDRLPEREKEDCPDCDGFGAVDIGGITIDCQRCEGNGWILLEGDE